MKTRFRLSSYLSFAVTHLALWQKEIHNHLRTVIFIDSPKNFNHFIVARQLEAYTQDFVDCTFLFSFGGLYHSIPFEEIVCHNPDRHPAVKCAGILWRFPGYALFK